jgi:hypothetical protein
MRYSFKKQKLFFPPQFIRSFLAFLIRLLITRMHVIKNRERSLSLMFSRLALFSHEFRAVACVCVCGCAASQIDIIFDIDESLLLLIKLWSSGGGGGEVKH